MRQTEALAKLNRLEHPIFQTQDVSALLNISSSYASHLLSRLEKDGLVFRIKKGLWSLEGKVSNFDLACYITFPAPAYVSLQSALNHHGIIEQIPGHTYCIALTTSKQVITTKAVFSVHRVDPKFFFGFEPYGQNQAMIATPEKALVDFYYLSATRSNQFKSLPELHLEENFEISQAHDLVTKIPSKRIKTIVKRKLSQLNI